MSSKVSLQKGTYRKIRARFHLPAQMACSIPRHVGATYKMLCTKSKQNAAHRRAGYTRKRYKGLDQPPKFISPTLTYQLGRDYSFKTEQRVSILTLQGRVIVPYTGYSKHVSLLQHESHIGAAQLWYDKSKKQFYLLVSLEIEGVEPTPQTHQQVVGVDVGQRYLAVSTNTQNQTTFYSGKAVRAKADHYARLRKRLQHKGTRSATRRLKVISGRERRFKLNVNHIVSKRIIEQHPQAIIGLEHLTDIQDRIKRKRGKRATSKQRIANQHASKWAFAELHSLLVYKSSLYNSIVIKVDAHFTSQACPRCGYTSKANRPNMGLLFVCQNCHYRLHADLVGARNITMRTLDIRQDWMTTGVLSVRPDVSSDEAKAAWRERYAELRWSLDTSLPALAVGLLT
jgi:putative transposase